MSEELIKRGYTKNGKAFGRFEFYNIGDTTINSLISYNIVPKKDYKKYTAKKPDGLICDRRNKKNVTVIAVIENKQPSELNSKNKILEH